MHATTLAFTLQLPADLPFAFSIQTLAAELETLEDQRDPRGVRYPLVPLLALAVCAKLAGHQRLDALADWARLRAPQLATLFHLKRPTMPHPSTWSRVLGAAVDVHALEHVLSRFFQATQHTAEVPARGSLILAVDGRPYVVRSPLAVPPGCIWWRPTYRKSAWCWPNWPWNARRMKLWPYRSSSPSLT